MYGQYQGGAVPPYQPVGAPAVKPPKPGPTGTGVAVASAGVLLACIVANIALKLLWRNSGVDSEVGRWIWILSFNLIDLIPLVYLAIVGRGSVGKAFGAGLMAVAFVLDAAIAITYRLVAGYPMWLEVLDYTIGFLFAVLVVTAWGVARRSGRLWTLSIPIGMLLWALWSFVIIKSDAFTYTSDNADSLFQQYGRTILWALVVFAFPIVVGWVLELVSRGSAGPNTPHGGNPQFAVPPQQWQVNPMPSQPMQRPQGGPQFGGPMPGQYFAPPSGAPQQYGRPPQQSRPMHRPDQRPPQRG